MANDNHAPYSVTFTRQLQRDFDNQQDMLGFVATLTDDGYSLVEIITRQNGGADE